MTDTTPLHTDDGRRTVLVVDDEERLADLYATYLADDYEVRTAYDGEQALERVDHDVDVVLLDRRMPGIDGDEVLTEIQNRGLDCRVAMVTAVDPDLDIIDMPFDDYLVKPASEAEIREAVERLLLLDRLTGVEYELSSLRVKRNVLETELDKHERRESEEFQRLERRMHELREEMSALRKRLDESLLTAVEAT